MSVLETLSQELGFSLADIKELGGYVLAAYGGLLGIALIHSVIDGRKARASAERKERREEIRERLDEIRLEKAEAELKAQEAEEAAAEHEECEDRRRTQEEALSVYEELAAQEQELEMQEQEFETIVNGVDEDDGVYIYKDC